MFQRDRWSDCPTQRLSVPFAVAFHRQSLSLRHLLHNNEGMVSRSVKYVVEVIDVNDTYLWRFQILNKEKLQPRTTLFMLSALLSWAFAMWFFVHNVSSWSVRFSLYGVTTRDSQ